jgi:prepilin-type N-terminal cleavage/methylation domain-containing protein
MSHISDHRPSVTGFTLVELLVAMSLMVTLMAGVLSAYLFLGRNLTRLVNLQQQSTKTRHTLRVFAQDVGAASKLTAATSTISGNTTTAAHFAVLVPTSADGSTTKTVTYDYLSATGKLTRTDPSGALDVLTDITDFSINYYTQNQTSSGTAFSATLAAPANSLSIKAIEFKFTTSVGSAAAGTQATYSAMSPRVLLRNRTSLQ